MSTLWKRVLTESMKSYTTRIDSNGKMHRTVANYGLPPGGLAIRARDGEYSGLTVKSTKGHRPLLTSAKVSRALKLLADENIAGAVRTLQLDDEVKTHGIGLMYHVLKIWLERNKFTPPTDIVSTSNKTVPVDIKLWALSVSHDPLIGEIEIVAIGKSKKGHSVVPESWLGKKFKGGRELHADMDRLDWRKGKPPVFFCSVYSMQIKDTYQWTQKREDVTPFAANMGIQMLVKSDLMKLQTDITEFSSQKEYHKWLNKLPKTVHILPAELGSNVINKGRAEKVVFAVSKEYLFESKPKYGKKSSVGLLVSLLQKAIRRGRKCPKTLSHAVTSLVSAPPYNLPDQQFIKVSGARQLLWRLFITCMEDSEPYLTVPQGSPYFSLLEIVCLSLVTQADADLVLNKQVTKKLVHTALLIQYQDARNWDWRSGKDLGIDSIYVGKDMETPVKNSIVLGIRCMPMMSNDRRLLNQGLGLIEKKKIVMQPLKIVSVDKLLQNSDKVAELSATLAGHDMHCFPNMIIHLQGALSHIPTSKPHTTQGLSSFIWENSSKLNVRNNDTVTKSTTLENLYTVQRDYYAGCELPAPSKKLIAKNSSNKYKKGSKIKNYTPRLAFLLIFGEKVRLNKPPLEVVVAGDAQEVCKVKKPSGGHYNYLTGKDRVKGEDRYVEFMDKKHGRTRLLPDPPQGYQWVFKKSTVKVSVEKKKGKLLFTVDGITVNPFDGAKFVTPNQHVVDSKLPSEYIKIVDPLLYRTSSKTQGLQLNRLAQAVCQYRRKYHDNRAFDWFKFGDNVPKEIWRDVLVKISNRYQDSVGVGPVDRSGKKVNEAINYYTEGVVWRILNCLSMLYPNCLHPSGAVKFKIHTTSSEFGHLCKSLLKLSRSSTKVKSVKVPTVKTTLWDHQKRTSTKIIDGMIQDGKKGFGDASHVGAGKTLTAISVMRNLLKHNIKNKLHTHTGFVVLLPTTKLYPTWEDEIKKHTTGFDVITQQANGTLERGDTNVKESDIAMNSIVVTTLGRMRDHPLGVGWQLVVIDECLTVQNRDALQTEEAWRQVINSQYGVLMMSATFFRSRFDKMFYMLKMLRSGLPEKKEYLDTILTECMVCYIPSKGRKWITQTHKNKLPSKLRKGYDAIKNQDIGAEKLYMALSNYLYKKHDFVKVFKEEVKKLEKKHKLLIYARSKAEADGIANSVSSVSRYPDKSGKHVVVSYTEGTYGLNDLVGYDTILTRPQEPDKIPQMKGRLDRPGQKKDVLNIVYLVTEDTIEEAWLLRLEIANYFHKHHIMPLAEFYQLAVGKKKM